MNGTIFNIQRFCVQDGPGIRTTVFLKGCPLRCIWCHNPESQTVHQEILYQPRQCIGCMACASVCPNGCHEMTEEGHIFNRENAPAAVPAHRPAPAAPWSFAAAVSP